MSQKQEADPKPGASGHGAAASGAEPAWLTPLRAALALAPDPEQAMRSSQDLLETETAEGVPIAARLAGCSGERAQKLARILFAICGIAPFLASHFRSQPEWLFELLDDDLGVPREPALLRERIDAALARDADREPAAVLRAFKYFELARLTVRDADPDWVPLDESATTLREVSQLADVILARGLAITEQAAREQLGPPRWRTESGGELELGFCVLGLGKLGSEELNYSSDVDLIYVYETPREALALGDRSEQEAGRFAELAPLDYFTRLAQGFGQLISQNEVDGFLYRIDLDLRPEGAQGTLVTGSEALASYYEAWADTWERAAFMKARPVAGDLRLGWRAIRQVDPMIYHSTMDYDGVDGIRSLKQKVEQKHRAAMKGFNVKIDPGGIRDVEFVAQALQLLHGGRIPQIRERSTQRALQNLADVGLLEQERVAALLAAYRFLRRTENRLQMEGEQQRHVLPKEPAARERLARAMGFVEGEPAKRFMAELEVRRKVVLSHFGGSMAGGDRERILELFERIIPKLLLQPGVRPMIEQLAEQIVRSIDASPDRERALNNLDRFVQGVGGRHFYYELLIDRPELVPRLMALFGSSKYLSGYLVSHPRLIEPVFADPNTLLLSRDELRADLAATRAAGDGSPEQGLDALRIFQHRQLLNVGLLDVGEKVSRAEAEGALSEIAEVCLEDALDQAEQRMRESRDGIPEAAARGAYLVVGMGKLGSRELSYGSDLDLIFLFDLPEQDSDAIPMAQHYFVRLTQRLISILQTATKEGSCYEIDARLRPSGNQGTLVTSRAGFVRYHRESAEVWERQALLRARPISGDAALARRFEEIRLEVLQRPLPDDLAGAIDHVRQRMEVELANETDQRRNFKTGRGGLLDIETVVQYLTLLHGAQHPDLFVVDRLERQLDRLLARELLEPQGAATLRGGWEFLQGLGNRLRIVENRSISDLDSERGDLDGVARHLGYAETGRGGGARRALLRDYRQHTEAIRRIYEQVLRAGSQQPGPTGDTP